MINKIGNLKKLLIHNNINYFILPNNDEFFLEYIPENEQRIKYLTGFTGSNAILLINASGKSCFFTDGRYILQAQNELKNGGLIDEFEIINLGEVSFINWLQENLTKRNFKENPKKCLKEGSKESLEEDFGENIKVKPVKVGINSKLTNISMFRSFEYLTSKGNIEFIYLDEELEIFDIKNNNQSSKIFAIEEGLSGISSEEKLDFLINNFDQNFGNIDALFISDPHSVCWLLNIRARDLEYTPILIANLILYKDKTIEVFTKNFVDKVIEIPNYNIKFYKIEEIENVINNNFFDIFYSRNIRKIQIDPKNLNYYIYNLLNKFEIIEKEDVVLSLRAIKNKNEVFGFEEAHKIDGLAVTKFIYWLENVIKKGEEIDEIDAEEKLLFFRQLSKNFYSLSFNSICGADANGAIIHYHATKETNKIITKNSIFLFDSGAQYLCENFFATTDITRTICFEAADQDIIDNFTLVLKGHLALARVNFKKGTTGANLDILARSFLWNKHLDYDHGTGHGVGSFLSVHEGPMSISRKNDIPFKSGMILSNEPGFYKDGEYGIRIENLILVTEAEHKKFLKFKTLTLVPIDHKLINFKMMTYPERKWLKEYHEKILEEFKDKLNTEELDWLSEITEFYKSKFEEKR